MVLVADAGISRDVQETVEREGARPLRKTISTEQLVQRLRAGAEAGDISLGMRTIRDYVGADGYLFARQELNSEHGLDNIISSDWPFDLVRSRGIELIGRLAKTTELDKCLQAQQPSFSMLPEEEGPEAETSREYCTIMFSAGRNRYCLLFICPPDVILSQQRLRETGILASYFASLLFHDQVHASRDTDLTERELECLYWIAEGKTSDEIATIIGISKNTINNYITSVMRKTATKTRSEAIAYAVRHNLV